jgi:hypothetical protein
LAAQRNEKPVNLSGQVGGHFWPPFLCALQFAAAAASHTPPSHSPAARAIPFPASRLASSSKRRSRSSAGTSLSECRVRNSNPPRKLALRMSCSLPPSLSECRVRVSSPRPHSPNVEFGPLCPSLSCLRSSVGGGPSLAGASGLHNKIGASAPSALPKARVCNRLTLLSLLQKAARAASHLSAQP